jgi:alcohol dehydrogenase class IV
LLSGQGTDFTGAGLATALGHAIGVLAGLENGVAKAIVLPAVLRFNSQAASRGLANVSSAMGAPTGADLDNATAVGQALSPLLDAARIPHRLRDAGIGRESLAKIASKTMSDWFLLGNARPIQDAAEVERVLLDAW